MRWRWPWHRDLDGESKIRAEAEAEERAAKRRTEIYEKMAGRVADLPPDEFADRVARAFRQRPA